jgi:putative Mg2+ transporter-C (MgtC) family protein
MADLAWYEIVLRLAVGAVLAAIVGLERESAGQDAGFRTHLLLGLGAALFGVISVGAFDDFTASSADTNVRVDVTRVASYVAAGIGFIGGGAILKHAGSVRGITTAASIWAAAAIGLAAGLGSWVAASTGTVVAVIALAVLRPVSKWLGRRSRVPKSLQIVVTRLGAATSVLGVLEAASIPQVKAVSIGEAPHDSSKVQVLVELWSWPHGDVVDRLVDALGDALGDDLQSVTPNL